MATLGFHWRLWVFEAITLFCLQLWVFIDNYVLFFEIFFYGD